MQDQVLSQIIEHAERVFPREACGLIINTGYSYIVIECDNESHEPDNSFLINPLIYAQWADKLACVYHSHPNRSPEPSPADIASSERCNVPFMIVGIPTNEVFVYKPTGILPAPYEGRQFIYGVMDCLSLVSDYYQHELQIIINDGERKSWEWWQDPQHENAFINGFLANGFITVTELQPDDIIIMSLGGYCPNHAAIYQGNNTILHHPSRQCNSRIEMYGQYWQQNTVCYLRHHEKN